LLATSGVASAEPASVEGATISQLEYRRAHEAARRHDWLEARRILLELWARAKTYDVAASLSEAEFALGHPAASAQYMDYALSHVTPNESAATVANMRAALSKLQPQIATIELTSSEPLDAVTLDGVALEFEQSARIFVEPGRHVFRAQAGGRTSQRTIEAGAGAAQTLKLELPPVAAAAAMPIASSTRSSDATDGGPEPRTVALLVSGALALGGLGTGVGFGVASNAAESDVTDYRARVGVNGCPDANTSPDCRALRDAIDSQRHRTQLANVGYGVGAAAGLVTLGVALLWPTTTQHAEKPARVSRLQLRWSGHALELGGDF
jgi:hypothetical protein